MIPLFSVDQLGCAYINKSVYCIDVCDTLSRWCMVEKWLFYWWQVLKTNAARSYDHWNLVQILLDMCGSSGILQYLHLEILSRTIENEISSLHVHLNGFNNKNIPSIWMFKGWNKVLAIDKKFIKWSDCSFPFSKFPLFVSDVKMSICFVVNDFYIFFPLNQSCVFGKRIVDHHNLYISVKYEINRTYIVW